MKILITGGKTATAFKLIKAFEANEILLGDYGNMPNINTNSYSFVGLGDWAPEVLAHNLLTKCLDYGANVLLPLYEAEIEALSRSLVLFGEFGLKVLLPETIQLSQSKFKDFCVFENNKLVYTSAEIDVKSKLSLNGVYSFDPQAGEFALISLSNPV